jgi:hypothetical protein
MGQFREKENLRGGEREGGDSRDPALKNIGTCAHPERGVAVEGQSLRNCLCRGTSGRHKAAGSIASIVGRL